MNEPPAYPRTPCWPTSPSKPRGDRNTRHAGEFPGADLTVTEKLDGSSVLIHEGRVLTRGGDPHAPWLAMARKHHGWKLRGQPGLCLYAEDIYGVHSIAYDPVPEARTLYVFAALEDGRFLSFPEVEEIAERLDIPTVPVLVRARFDSFDSVEELEECLREHHREPSVLGGDREGVVVRHTAGFSREEFHRRVFKSVRAGHVQTDEHWTRNWKPCRIAR